MLSDPRPALADQSGFHHALLGLASLAELVGALGSGPAPAMAEAEVDDLVYALLGVVGLGDRICRLATSPDPEDVPEAVVPPEPGEWLR
jgi:hypothetical protein